MAIIPHTDFAKCSSIKDGDFTKRELQQKSSKNLFVSLPTKVLEKISLMVATGSSLRETAANVIQFGRVCIFTHLLMHDTKMAKITDLARLEMRVTCKETPSAFNGTLNQLRLLSNQRDSLTSVHISPDQPQLMRLPPEIESLTDLQSIRLPPINHH